MAFANEFYKENYVVTYKHVHVSCDLSEIEQKLVHKLCLSAIYMGIQLQCGREYMGLRHQNKHLA